LRFRHHDVVPYIRREGGQNNLACPGPDIWSILLTPEKLMKVFQAEKLRITDVIEMMFQGMKDQARVSNALYRVDLNQFRVRTH
jgi:hypothetical protein